MCVLDVVSVLLSDVGRPTVTVYVSIRVQTFRESTFPSAEARLSPSLPARPLEGLGFICAATGKVISC